MILQRGFPVEGHVGPGIVVEMFERCSSGLNCPPYEENPVTRLAEERETAIVIL